MNKQELFDKVVSYASTQMQRSISPETEIKSETCRYRGPNGNKCWIGALIPDSEYEEIFEGQSVLATRISIACGIENFRDLLPLAHRLQYTHDNIPIKNWPNELEQIAIKFKLDFNKQHFINERRLNEQAQDLQGS